MPPINLLKGLTGKGGAWEYSSMMKFSIVSGFCSLLLLACCALTVHAQQPIPRPQGWKDTEGHFINAHGAGILYHKGVYYLFGEIKKGSTWQVPGQSWEDYRVPAGGVSCYSSRD